MTALLPRDDQDAAIVNAAMMELGALVCTARAARCDVCPISALCAWRAATPTRAICAAAGCLRGQRPSGARSGAARCGRRRHALTAVADSAQRDRAIDSLIVDGLVEAVDGNLRLPQ
jgi:A/G-specific adenine glycosylase